MVAAGAVVNIHDREEFTPLHTVSSGEVAAALIAAGARVGAVNVPGDEPLHCARTAGVVQVLVTAGEDIRPAVRLRTS